MPEAGGSFSVRRDAARHAAPRAGFPSPGSPPLRPWAEGHGRVGPLAALALLVLLLAPLARASAAARHPAAHHTPFGVTEAAEVADPDLRAELTAISREFATTVTAKTLARFGRRAGHRRFKLVLSPSAAYRDTIRADALKRLRQANADLSQSQYFVYADRNPAAQVLFLAFYDATAQTVRLLGADFISSGKLRQGKDSFLTPVGVFENLPDNWGYRAQGTKNDKGWRGLGAQGSRVWDFGYQQAPRRFSHGVYDSQMRLLMHATDPDNGEPRLGGPDSKGCVRISATANAFLDRHGILDRLYEQLAATDPDHSQWLLRKDRTPAPHAGSYLVVGDSAIQSASR